MAYTLQQLDAMLAEGFKDWNGWTIVLIALIIAFLTYPAFFSPEPDLHPLLLARQSAPSRVRQSHESAPYRSLDTPYGFPLRSSLSLKTTSSRRAADLRDIFEQAAYGPIESDARGRLTIVLGKEQQQYHEFRQLSSAIFAVGQHLQQQKASRVAICLSNSLELLVAIFGWFNSQSAIVG